MTIEQAIIHTPRANFMLPGVQEVAGIDAPQPIGYGQTISQPTVVVSMLEWLDVKTANKVLDVGLGSGWTTALLSRLTGPDGHVYATEIVPELLAFGRDNCNRLNITNASFHAAHRHLGLPDHAPFDRILVSAAATSLPMELIHQLTPGGRMVIPVRTDILEITTDTEGRSHQTVHPGYMFVPLRQ